MLQAINIFMQWKISSSFSVTYPINCSTGKIILHFHYDFQSGIYLYFSYCTCKSRLVQAWFLEWTKKKKEKIFVFIFWNFILFFFKIQIILIIIVLPLLLLFFCLLKKYKKTLNYRKTKKKFKFKLFLN